MSGTSRLLLAVMNARLIFGLLGNVTAFITFLLPARDLYKIRQGRIGRSAPATEQHSPVPYEYHAAITSCLLWAWYGNEHGDVFLAVNFLGVVLEILYLNLFILLITRTCNGKMKHYVILLVELLCVFVLGSFALTFDDPAKFSGTVCLTGNILVFVLKMVYGTRRPPIDESAASFVNGAVWSIYGIVSSNIFILVPNLVVALVELVQYAIQSRSPEAPRPISEEMAPLSRAEPELPELEP